MDPATTAKLFVLLLLVGSTTSGVLVDSGDDFEDSVGEERVENPRTPAHAPTPRKVTESETKTNAASSDSQLYSSSSLSRLGRSQHSRKASREPQLRSTDR